MEPLKVGDVVRAAFGSLVRPGRDTITGVSIDSRTVAPGDLFFAVRGERFDGHRFAAAAVARGAAGVVVADTSILPAEGLVIVVGDTRRSLGDLARYYRGRFKTRVAAVTGSNGKTTTRDMIAAVLSREHRVVCAQGSYNNDIGVPLTVFRLDSATEFGVFEIEMNQFGGTKMLARVCRPEVGIVTNIGDTHLEFMKDRRGVALEKQELLRELPKAGSAVVNADDEMVMAFSRRACRSRCLTFGIENKADVFATDIAERGLEGCEFRLQGEHSVRLGLPGRHNVYNFLAAAGACRALGFEFPTIAGSARRMRPAPMRLAVKRLGPVVLIDDSYNANPQSMEAALGLLCRNAEPGRRVAILGDMMELGGFAVEAHSRVGQLVAGCVDRVAFVGPLGQHAAAVAVKAGLDPGRVRLYTASGQVLAELFDIVKPKDTILVKGSRPMKMELVTEAITKKYGKESD